MVSVTWSHFLIPLQQSVLPAVPCLYIEYTILVMQISYLSFYSDTFSMSSVLTSPYFKLQPTFSHHSSSTLSHTYPFPPTNVFSYTFKSLLDLLLTYLICNLIIYYLCLLFFPIGRKLAPQKHGILCVLFQYCITNT